MNLDEFHNWVVLRGLSMIFHGLSGLWFDAGQVHRGLQMPSSLLVLGFLVPCWKNLGRIPCSGFWLKTGETHPSKEKLITSDLGQISSDRKSLPRGVELDDFQRRDP